MASVTTSSQPSRMPRALCGMGAALLLGLVWWKNTDSSPIEVLPEQQAAGVEQSVDRKNSNPGKAQDSPEREPANPVDIEAAKPVAVSHSQSELTLVGHLIGRVQKMPWGDGRDYERQSTIAKDPQSIANDAGFNPRGHKLNDQQLLQLRAIVEAHGKLVKEAAVEEGRHRKRATILALKEGRLDSVSVPSPKSVIDPAEIRRVRELSKPIVQEMIDNVTLRHGKVGRDFIYSMMNSSQPDGVSRQSMVVISRRADPSYFAALERLRQCERDRDADFKAFFEGL